MRYENLKYSNDILPIIRRHDSRRKTLYNMYMHWHDAIEILLIMEGKMNVLSGKEHTVVEQGQLVCIHAGHLHLYDPITEFCRYYCIIFPPDALDGKELYYSNLPRISEDAQAKEWMVQLLAIIKEKAPFWQEKGKALLTLIVARLAEIGGDVCYEDSSRPSQLVKAAMAYIDKYHLNPTLSLEEIATQLHISPYHLSHVFKKVTGKSISSYWQAQRLDVARRLLVSGNSILEAAEKAGFSSQSYFCRAFQKQFGTTPSQYRKNNIT